MPWVKPSAQGFPLLSSLNLPRQPIRCFPLCGCRNSDSGCKMLFLELTKCLWSWGVSWDNACKCSTVPSECFGKASYIRCHRPEMAKPQGSDSNLSSSCSLVYLYILFIIVTFLQIPVFKRDQTGLVRRLSRSNLMPNLSTRVWFPGPKGWKEGISMNCLLTSTHVPGHTITNTFKF